MPRKPTYDELALRIRELEEERIEVKKIDAELQENRNFLASIFASIQDGISILDLEMNIIQVNPCMEKWYSHALPLVGKKCFQAYHEQDSACGVCPVAQTIRTGKTAHEVVPKRGAGGRITGWLDLFSFPMFDQASGKFRGVIEYVRDISEQKTAEQALQKAHDELEQRIRDRTVEITGANLKLREEIRERKLTEQALRRSEIALAEQKAALEETNTALKILLQKMKQDKKEITEQVLFNFKELVAPYLEKLRQSGLDEKQKGYLELAQSTFNDIIFPFVRSISLLNIRLSPAEIRVADLIRQGKTSKEIAEFMHVSPETVKVHRKNIRGKLGLKGKKVNLQTVLRSFGQDTPE